MNLKGNWISGGICVLLLAATIFFPLLSWAQAPVWGVLNLSSGDNATYNGYTTTADGWIAKAEIDSGDNGSTCTGRALTFEETAETAYLQWKTSDYNHEVRLVEIPAKWKYYQPNWDSGSPVNDPCYTRFLTNIVSAYKAAGYSIAYTISIKDGPAWLNSSTNCPNCLYKSQDGHNPEDSSSTLLYLPNVVFDQQVRTLAENFIDASLALATDAVHSVSSSAVIDYLRVGISENGETLYPAGILKNSSGTVIYSNQWWAMDGAAQAYATAGTRVSTIPDPPDCLFGWYPGEGAPATTAPNTYCTIPTGLSALQATEDWWGWYFRALADAHAWFYARLRTTDGYTGPIVFVTPGNGIPPDQLINHLTYVANSDWTDYDSHNPYETLNEAAAWWVFYDQIIYQLHHSYDTPYIGAMGVDISSVQADAYPSYSGTAMNPVAECNYDGTDNSGVISPAPTYATSFTVSSSGYTYSSFPSSFDNWSSIRTLTYIAGISGSTGLLTMGENAGSNPYAGSLSGSSYKTGMKDVVTLLNSCSPSALMWAFDNQLNSGSSSYASGAQYKSCIDSYPTCP
jgi:hypothetical protein